MDLYFSDYFRVDPGRIERFGAFNISLVADLPLFVNPFLLFNSRKRRYKALHDAIIAYLSFLRDKSSNANLDPELINSWYRFPEVTQTWLGFSATGNKGSGLGKDFATALHENLHRIFHHFGAEKVTKGSHLEKLCLIKDRVGKDNISDFTTNLIREFLVQYTEDFALKYIDPNLRRKVTVGKVRFNYDTESWQSDPYELPWFRGDYVLLVPKDILTKDDTWINKADLIEDFEWIPDSIPNDQLRAQVNNYFLKALPKRATKEEHQRAVTQTILQFPELIDYYIRYKEDNGEKAESISAQKVATSERLYVERFRDLAELLFAKTEFYTTQGATYEEAHQRIAFFKDVVENKGGHKIFYLDGRPIEREEDVHILFRLTWYATPSDVSREVNDGRGPADFKISRGAKDKTVVEFKLAKNSQLQRNLERQTPIYKKASDARKSIKAIIYFSKSELDRVNRILKALKIESSPDIILIDARADNKPSGSKA